MHVHRVVPAEFNNCLRHYVKRQKSFIILFIYYLFIIIIHLLIIYIIFVNYYCIVLCIIFCLLPVKKFHNHVKNFKTPVNVIIVI